MLFCEHKHRFGSVFEPFILSLTSTVNHLSQCVLQSFVGWTCCITSLCSLHIFCWTFILFKCFSVVWWLVIVQRAFFLYFIDSFMASDVAFHHFYFFRCYLKQWSKTNGVGAAFVLPWLMKGKGRWCVVFPVDWDNVGVNSRHFSMPSYSVVTEICTYQENVKLHVIKLPLKNWITL